MIAHIMGVPVEESLPALLSWMGGGLIAVASVLSRARRRR